MKRHLKFFILFNFLLAYSLCILFFPSILRSRETECGRKKNRKTQKSHPLVHSSVSTGAGVGPGWEAGTQSRLQLSLLLPKVHISKSLQLGLEPGTLIWVAGIPTRGLSTTHELKLSRVLAHFYGVQCNIPYIDTA